MYIISCRICAVQFEAKTARRVYCGQRCKDKGKPSVVNSGLTCKTCSCPMVKRAHSAPQGVAECRSCRGVEAWEYPTTRKLSSEIAHGDMAMYYRGCRCASCLSTKAESMFAYKEKVRAEHGVGPSSLFKRRFKDENGIRYQESSTDWIHPAARLAIYERDSWNCHLCGEDVDRDVHWNGDLFPSLDHLIPRSKGGSDEVENLKTAHRLCNSIRQDAPLVA